jgi:hypothetical protein
MPYERIDPIDPRTGTVEPVHATVLTPLEREEQRRRREQTREERRRREQAERERSDSAAGEAPEGRVDWRA